MPKLNEEKVILMREMARNNELSLGDIAQEFGVDPSIVSRIIRGKAYSWVPGDLPERDTSKLFASKHGENWRAIIGAKGGRNGHTGGFYADRELARRAGAIGGRISRKRKATAVSDGDHENV